MTTKLDPRLKPADDHTDSSPTTGTDGEEVKDVAIFESRRARSKKRAWDELSEIDRAVILETVRQRRKARQRRRGPYDAAHSWLRANR
jgi:hypothetical protein